MSSEIADRLLDKLLMCRVGFNAADWDEIEILHSYCEKFFSNSFNQVISKFSFNHSTQDERKILVDRLLRIHEVEASIPESIRFAANGRNVASGALIPTFDLDETGRARISELCEQMRKIVFASRDFDEPHRLRLLNRIAAIEGEILKPKGMFDVVMGGMSDLGEALGKFGKDIKPLTDRMREVVSIARKSTKEYDQLPAPDEIKQLPAPSADERE